MSDIKEYILEDVELGKIKELSDDVIMAMYKDTKGNLVERLRIVSTVEGTPIYLRFPSYGKYNEFASAVSRLYLLMSSYAQNIMTAELINFDQEQFQVWASLAAVALQAKKPQKLIENIIFKYLRPEIPRFSSFYNRWYGKYWMRNNMGIDTIVSLLATILLVDNWSKKKSNLILAKTFQQLTSSLSPVQSEKKQDGESNKSVKLQSSSSELLFSE